MKTIQLESYEINDLIRILNYALDKKREDLVNEKINSIKYKMDKSIINNILARVPESHKEKGMLDLE